MIQAKAYYIVIVHISLWRTNFKKLIIEYYFVEKKQII